MSLIGKNVGNYRVIAKIGEGGMGSVYLGEHPMIGKRVAIKTLHPDLASKEDIISRFFTEAKAVNDIGHANIVDIIDYGKMRDDELNADAVYFVMEFLDGEGLNVRLKRDGVSPKESIYILRQCCSALAASHKKHIVHRDLKPENIYLITKGDDKNYVKLLDFGIAKLTGSESSVSQHKTRTGLVIGTPAYMSPEQCEGKGNVDWRSDIYSLGVLFYEMLTGRVPFPGDGFGEVLVAHLTKTPDLPSQVRQDVPAGLEAICMHALEKDKNRRFQSMEEMIAAFDDPGAHLASYGSPSGRVDASVASTMMGAAPSVASQSQNGLRVPTGLNPRVPTGEGPRPTTLSGSSGEVAGDGSRPKSKAPLFAVLGLLVVAGGGAAFVMKQKADTTAAAEKARVEAIERAALEKANKPVEKVKITITSEPSGAKVFRAPDVTTSVGVTPFELESKKNDDFDVLVKLDGYKSETRTVDTSHAAIVSISLTRIETAKPVTPVIPAVTVTARDPGKVKKGGTSAVTKGGKGKGGGDRDDVMTPNF